MNITLKQYIPNYITFISLGLGLVSIVFSIQGQILLAGMMIVTAVIFDSFDGFIARRLRLESPFGMELDSLTDMVCFGVAPVVLLSQHLHLQDRFTYWLVPLFLIQVWSGAFRLARFNLQPPKESSAGPSLGLTISLSGLILTLMVLSDLTQAGDDYPLAVFIGLILLLSFSMVSRIRIPALAWFVPHWALYILYGLALVALTIWYSIFTAVWFIWLGILAASILKHFIQGSHEEVSP
jgi:CDP-diacylglycerol--serine O-phosphatidyltransferase